MIMKYRIIDTTPSPSRVSDTIGANRRGISFNSLIRKKMGIARDSKIAFLVDENGFVAVNVLPKESPTGKSLIQTYGTANTLTAVSAKLARHIAPGRYHITGRDGAFWLTDMKWKE